jgi:hypothetical protein
MPTFKITARPTRGGYRGVVAAHNGAVAFKTMPIFRSEADAKNAAKAWMREHGAHADRRIAYRERKFIPKKFFALPERAPGPGSLPLADPEKGWRYDPVHVRNAATRLVQMHKRGSVNPEEFRRAERAIMIGACATGVERTCQRLMAKYSTRPVRAAAYTR